MGIGEDITGKVFGKLTVLNKTDKRGGQAYLWECVCECGNKRLATHGNLKHHITSCGCSNKTAIKHGDWNKRIRHIWNGMMKRCYNKKDIQYKNYGGRGIDVYFKWHNYSVFKEWAYMNGYSDNLSIDRYPDNNKGYHPDNVRWATPKQQNNNRRSNTIVEINGENKTISEWCDYYKINQLFVLKRQNRGWNIVDAILKPKRNYPYYATN